MRNPLLNYFLVNLFAGLLLLTGIMTTTALAEDTKLPDIDYLVRVAGVTTGWSEANRGAPQVRYIIDHATGKSYLVEVDYWSGARVLAEH